MTKSKAPRHGRYIVECPACEGTGRVSRPESVVLHGCRLCWERGVVSTIVAERWLNRPPRRDEAAG